MNEESVKEIQLELLKIAARMDAGYEISLVPGFDFHEGAEVVTVKNIDAVRDVQYLMTALSALLIKLGSPMTIISTDKP